LIAEPSCHDGRMSKILILTTSHGASHRRAAESLKKAFLEIKPDLSVSVVDALERCARWFRVYYDSYALPLRYWPGLWRKIENYQHRQHSTSPLWLYRWGGKPLFRFIHAFDPDVVIATEVGVCELSALYKRQTQARFFLVGLELMDFNQAWVQPEVDLYPVAHPDLGEELIAAGAPKSKVMVSGMPIDPIYTHLPSRAEMRARLNVRGDLPLILILFGGTGFGKPRRIVAELQKIPMPFQAVFIAGKNRVLENELRRCCGSLPYSQALGWVDNIHEWMLVSDLLISKPGGGTVMEAAACSLPLLALDPLPGNEERTCQWLEKWQIGIWIKNHAEISRTVERLLRTSDEHEGLRQKAREFSRPNAAYDAARVILDRAGFNNRASDQ
jgi:processive 1,2-diacylglycerol beta-glucosyltransferase